MEDLKRICALLEEDSLKSGLHYHFFKIGWYNEVVADAFRLSYHPDTTAFLIVSTPEMFEKTFVPYLVGKECTGVGDPLDQSLANHLLSLNNKFPEMPYEVIHDFQMQGNTRRPRILVQTAGHVSGAVYFYQRKDLVVDPWPETKKIFGVCLHPKYGGWFALRGAIVFANLQVGDVPRPVPIDILQSDEKKRELLEKYNFQWQDWSFRDVVPVESRYSDIQREYFSTKPSDRAFVIERIRSSVFLKDS